MSSKNRLRRGVLWAALIAFASAGAAAADSIYLKNGRVIRTPQTEVVGDRVVFLQYGAEITIPMDLVDRIEADGEVEDAPSAPLPSAPAGADADMSDDEEAEGDEEESVPEEETRSYWSGRVSSIEEERAELQEMLVDLRREERAFVFSRRSTAESRIKIEATQQRLADLDVEMKQLRREARRRGIPPGWLRGT